MLLLAGSGGGARVLRYTTEKINEKTLVRLARTRPMDTRSHQPSSFSAAPKHASRIEYQVVVRLLVLAAVEVLELEVISDLPTAVTSCSHPLSAR